jgi:hypothetical protein
MPLETNDGRRLSPQKKLRYARQVLLGEIGEAGQLRLCATRLRFGAASDPRAAAVAADYLLRAGIEITGDSDADELLLGDAGAIRELAGSSGFEYAAAALAGAFGAVEAIKAALGAGVPSRLPGDLVLAGATDRESASIAP